MASEGTVDSVHEAFVVSIRNDARPQSTSNQNLTSLSKAPSHTWSITESATETTASTIDSELYETKNTIGRLPWPSGLVRRAEFPQELLSAVFVFLSRQDLLSVARVSASFLVIVRKILYESMDLQGIPLQRIDKCMEILASRRDLASVVRTFASPKLPSFSDESPLSFLTFTIALYNMSQLSSLSLPRFDANLLYHTNFRLERVAFWSETMTEAEQHQFSVWLASQTELISISLPALTTDVTITPIIRNSPPVNPEAINTGEPPAQRAIVSKLMRFEGPPCLATSLIPGRPVSEVVLHIHNTLYDGLKPSALMASLAKSAVPITRLSIIPSSAVKLDIRTVERVLMSAGADIGHSVQTLEVDWMFEEHVVYKNLASIISRFTNLQMLHLRKKPSPFPLSPARPSSSPLSPTSVTSDSSTPSLLPPHRHGNYPPLPSPMVSDSGSISSSFDSDSRESREHKHLKFWAKSCPSLRTVVFLSGAEWCVVKRVKRTSMKGKKDRKPNGRTEAETINVLSFVRWRLDD